MIAVDSSALVALALSEPEGPSFGRLLYGQDCIIAWPTVLETHFVLLGRNSTEGLEILASWLAKPTVHKLPFDHRHYRFAAEAFQRYGRGRHPAGLNFGDCMSYAIARANEVPLLYKGADFALTDVRPALP